MKILTGAAVVAVVASFAGTHARCPRSAPVSSFGGTHQGRTYTFALSHKTRNKGSTIERLRWVSQIGLSVLSSDDRLVGQPVNKRTSCQSLARPRWSCDSFTPPFLRLSSRHACRKERRDIGRSSKTMFERKRVGLLRTACPFLFRST